MEMARLVATGFFATVAVAFLLVSSVEAIRLAKKGKSGAHVLGAAFLLFGFGNFRDPMNEVVQEAKQLKKREEDDAGNPDHHA
jgi:hypothetical protein